MVGEDSIILIAFVCTLPLNQAEWMHGMQIVQFCLIGRWEEFGEVFINVCLHAQSHSI